jgi:hypothetical protein
MSQKSPESLTPRIGLRSTPACSRCSNSYATHAQVRLLIDARRASAAARRRGAQATPSFTSRCWCWQLAPYVRKKKLFFAQHKCSMQSAASISEPSAVQLELSRLPSDEVDGSTNAVPASPALSPINTLPDVAAIQMGGQFSKRPGQTQSSHHRSPGNCRHRRVRAAALFLAHA